MVLFHVTLEGSPSLVLCCCDPPTARFSKLAKLKLQDNQISGSISAETIGNLSSLETWDMSTNLLEGELPQELGLIRTLKV